MTRSNKELIALNLLTYPTSKEAAEKSGVSHPRPRYLGRDVLGEQEVL